MEIVKLLRGILLSHHSWDFKRTLCKGLVDRGVVTDVSDDQLEHVCAFALTHSLGNDSLDPQELMLSVVLAGIAERKAQFFDRYLGHEVVIDLFQRAMLPNKSGSSSSEDGFIHHAEDSFKNRPGSGVGSSVSSSVAPSPMSVSGPPTPSTMPPSPTNSTASSQASFGSLCPPSSSQSRGNDAHFDGSGNGSSSSVSVELASKLLENVNNGDGSAFHSSTSSAKNDDPSISASISRQRGIWTESPAVNPKALLHVLSVCLRAMSTNATSDNMLRRHRLIAAHMGKLLKTHDSLDIALNLIHFLESHPECVPKGEAADILCRAFVGVLAGARPSRPQVPSRELEIELMKKFVVDVNVVTQFLKRLWTEDVGSSSVEGNAGDVASRLLGTVLQETFEILLSPRVSRNDPSPSPRPVRGEPFLQLAAILNLIPEKARLMTAHELATDRVNASDKKLQTLLKRMCEWVLLLPMVQLTPIVATWVETIVDRLAAEWRYTPLMATCEAESANLWMTATLSQKKPIVRESALRILTRLLLGYQHGPKVYFGQISYDFVTSLPRVVTEDRAISLLPAISKLISGLLRLHGLPQTFTYSPHIFDSLKRLPAIDAMELETYLHSAQWNAKRLPRGWVGLINIGNTCFANSAIQAIRSCSEFTRDVLALTPSTSLVTQSHFTSASTTNRIINGKIVPVPNENNKETSPRREKELERERNNRILIKLQFLLAKLVFSQRPCQLPREFIAVSRPSYFNVGAQQDCVEYIDYLFAVLNETEKADQEAAKRRNFGSGDDVDRGKDDASSDQKPNPPEKIDLSSTTVWRNFGLLIENHHVCHACGYYSVKEDAHTNIPLPLVDEAQLAEIRKSQLAQSFAMAERKSTMDAGESNSHSDRRESSHIAASIPDSADGEDGRPAKVLCGEDNSIPTRTLLTAESHLDAFESPPSSCPSTKGADPARNAEKDDAGESKEGEKIRDATSTGIVIPKPRGMKFSPMTPASSPSPSSPPSVAALSKDVIFEEDEEEDEDRHETPLLGKDPFLGSSVPLNDDYEDDDIDDRKTPPPLLSPDGSNGELDRDSSEFESASVSRFHDGFKLTPSAPSASLAEMGSDFFDPRTLANKLEELHRRGGPSRQEKWERMDDETNVDDNVSGVAKMDEGSSAASSLPAPVVSSAEAVTVKKPDLYRLPNLLDCYLSTEYLVGDNAYHCERCDEKRSASRRAFIKRASDYLILPLLRFEFEGGRRLKKNDPVEIPQEIVVPVSCGDSPLRDSSGVAAIGTRSPPTSPTLPFVNVPYRLLAVVVHASANSDYGHYFTYVRTRPENNVAVGPSNSGWVLFNDAFAKEVPASTMESLLRTESSTFKNTAPQDANQRDTPYVLFYERVKSEADLGDAAKIDLRCVAPSLPHAVREHITQDNLAWLREKENSKSSGDPTTASTSASTSNSRQPPSGDDKGGGSGGGGSGGSGPCGGSGFGSLGNGPRFVF